MEFRKNRPPAIIAVFLLVILVLTTITYALSSPEGSAAADTYNKSNVKPLPVVGSSYNLKKLLQSANNSTYGIYRSSDMLKSIPLQAVQVDSMAARETASASDSLPQDYSATNIQVAGVDEADIIKTDGTYIYQVSNQRIVVAKAYPVTDMKVVNIIKSDDQSFTPTEIYVDSDRLVVIGKTSSNLPCLQDSPVKTSICPPYRHFDSTVTRIYNIADKNNIKLVREVEIEGTCVSSRKIGTVLYLVTNRYIDYACLEKGTETTPAFRDSAHGNNLFSADYSAIRYFPGDIYPNYITVAGIKLDNVNVKADIQTYLGSGENIYSSSGNLYVAVSKYQYWRPVTSGTNNLPEPAPQTESTAVYKFSLGNGTVKYAGQGKVPGTILNQYSMDEDNGYFRIATTKGQIWRNDENTSQNNIYILNGDMNIAGKLEGLAPGEKIYSTRFMGNRAYMVTFKKVDPLFVIDLKDPANPQILGKLKIPGYSNYLHPYDENHIIGFGKDTIEMKGWDGSNQAYYQGMKIALFDVTDVAKPIEMSKEIIGDRGTNSELLSNPKALLFNKDKSLLAFPVTVMKVDHTNISNNRNSLFPQYGSFAFQGAYIYNIDLVKGLTRKGTVTHLSAEDYARSGDNWYNSDNSIRRIIYINNILYTVSKKMIKANNLLDLKELGNLQLQ